MVWFFQLLLVIYTPWAYVSLLSWFIGFALSLSFFIFFLFWEIWHLIYLLSFFYIELYVVFQKNNIQLFEIIAWYAGELEPRHENGDGWCRPICLKSLIYVSLFCAADLSSGWLFSLFIGCISHFVLLTIFPWTCSFQPHQRSYKLLCD